MKKLLFVTLLMVLALAGQAQDSASLSKNILEAVKNNSITGLKKLVAPPDVYRKIYPKETGALSDAEIKAKTCDNPKLKADFEELQAKAKEKKIDLKSLHYDNITAENPWGTDEAPWAVTVHYTYKDKQGSISVSAIRFEGNWYFMEFLMPTQSFKEL